MNHHRANLLSIYQAAIAAVNGRRCVREWLVRHPQPDITHVIAIGKAAAAMAAAAREVLDDQLVGLLVITRHGYADPDLARDPRVQQLQAGHPVPDRYSLAAGQILLDFIAATPTTARMLFLLSGGASALVEVLPPGMTLDELQRVNHWLLGSGLPIHAINRLRIALSRIKGGRLQVRLESRQALVLVISDVAGDDLACIGSGLLYPPAAESAEAELNVPGWLLALLARYGDDPRMARSDQALAVTHHIVANAARARQAALQHARQFDYPLYDYPQWVEGDIHAVAQQLVQLVADQPPGLHVWSGETTVQLPEQPGNGGRCQSLALAVALGFEAVTGKGEPWLFLAAGSDGSDGPGQVAGAIVDSGSLDRVRAAGLDPLRCLQRADAGSCLQAAGDLVGTGPTGTNVMDIMLGLRLA